MQPFEQRELITTADGSHSLFVPALNEHYHSVHGAVQESTHVFLKHGLNAVAEKTTLRILEIGFGTGLNAWLTLLASSSRHIEYTALEAYPVDTTQALALNYATLPDAHGDPSLFAALHYAVWNEAVNITPNFILRKLHTTLEDYQPEPHSFDLIYFDAFAPRVQPELWTIDVFQKMALAAAPGAVLTTYCAKGDVRRNLQAAGFVTERLQGPPGKREMLRATKG